MSQLDNDYQLQYSRAAQLQDPLPVTLMQIKGRRASRPLYEHA
ncbi:hypothetical protein HMPREF3150_00201 [Pseudomonas aeruginosa]|nr:hypothetical protein HMPREF3150_00201 [Pseudomonas aeruginosa]